MLSLTKGRPVGRIEYKDKSDIPKDKSKRFIYISEDMQDMQDTQGVKGLEEISLPKNQTLVPLPNPKIREVLYVTGPSGSGKSHYSGNYIKEYLKMKKNQNNDYFVLSSVKSDQVLDKYNPIRIPIDNELVNDPLTIDDFVDSIIVFDDISTISNKKHSYCVNSIKDDLLEQGRHSNTTMVITSHLMSDYKSTRKILNESTSVTFFPRSGSTYQIKQFLKVYGGLEPWQIKKILKLPSRWITLYKTYPCYIIYEKGVFLCSKEED